jgi:hypothetical protein
MAGGALTGLVLSVSTATCFANLNAHPMGSCSEVSHHPENGGYYIEGVGGVHSDIVDNETGQRADNTLWAPNLYYPHMEKVLCTGMFCTEEARVNGSEQYVYAHTCGLLRFTYDPPSTVYEMADREHFDACDFTGAVLQGGANAGQPYFDYPIEVDHEKTYYYFASDPGCQQGQKVAVFVGDDYATNSATCASMGLGSSRIQNCDCNHQFKATTLIDPCFTGFRQGCLSDMPDDLSCCNPDTTYVDGIWSNCGTCIPKSEEQDLLDLVTTTLDLCMNSTQPCSAWEADDYSCPSRWSPAHNPSCGMWRAIQACTSATGDVLEQCNCDLNWVGYQKHMASVTTPMPSVTPTDGDEHDASGAPPMEHGKFVAIMVVLASLP